MKELDSSSTGNNTIDHDLISERKSEKQCEQERRNDRVITSNTSD